MQALLAACLHRRAFFKDIYRGLNQTYILFVNTTLYLTHTHFFPGEYDMAFIKHVFCLKINKYRKNIIFSSGRKLLGGHQAGLGLNEEFAMLISFFNAVGDLGVGALIAVGGDDAVDWVSLQGPLLLGLIPFRQLDLVDLLQKLRPIVVLIQHLDYHTHGCRFGWYTLVRYSNLWRRETSI